MYLILLRIIIKYGRRYETENAKFCEETFVVKREHTKIKVSNIFLVIVKSKYDFLRKILLLFLMKRWLIHT